MSSEGEHVDDGWNNDQSTNSGHDVCAKLGFWHFVVSELVPEILNGVETNQGGNEESNPLDTADASNAESSKCQPGEPLEAEALVLESVKSSPAEDRGEGKAEKHRVEEDESADSRVGVLAQDHESDKPHSWALEVELLSGKVCQWNADSAEECVKCAHEGVIEALWVPLSGLELEGSIVSSQVSRESDQHLPKRWVDIEVELSLEVVGTELSEAVLC